MRGSELTKLKNTADQDARYALLGDAQRIVAKDAVNGYIFQLPKIGIWRSGLTGFWSNSPIQANDVTGVHWN